MTSQVRLASIKIKTSVTLCQRYYAVERLNCMSYRCETVVYCFIWYTYFARICNLSLVSLIEYTVIFIIKGSKRLILSCSLLWHWRLVTMCVIFRFFSARCCLKWTKHDIAIICELRWLFSKRYLILGTKNCFKRLHCFCFTFAIKQYGLFITLSGIKNH